MNTPNLPPLPPQRVLRRVMPDDYRYCDVYGYTKGQMQAYARAAYRAGRDAGIAAALAAVRQRYAGDNNREDAEVLRCAMAIDALKSDVKTGALGADAGSKAVTKTGRDLYREAYPPAEGYAPWCEVDGDDQADWNAKAKENENG